MRLGKKQRTSKKQDAPNEIAHLVLSQRKTLVPSNEPKGIRLNSANHALNKVSPNRADAKRGDENLAKAKKTEPRPRFNAGPMSPTIPRRCLFAVPCTVT